MTQVRLDPIHARVAERVAAADRAEMQSRAERTFTRAATPHEFCPGNGVCFLTQPGAVVEVIELGPGVRARRLLTTGRRA